MPTSLLPKIFLPHAKPYRYRPQPASNQLLGGGIINANRSRRAIVADSRRVRAIAASGSNHGQRHGERITYNRCSDQRELGTRLQSSLTRVQTVQTVQHTIAHASSSQVSRALTPSAPAEMLRKRYCSPSFRFFSPAPMRNGSHSLLPHGMARRNGEKSVREKLGGRASRVASVGSN